MKKDLLSIILEESQSYSSLEKISQMVELGDNLKSIPLQPLYLTLKEMPEDQLTLVLPRLSFEQREAMLDLDLWNKDTVSPADFLPWLSIYSKCQDENLLQEFSQSEQFSLFLKASFNVWTFDVEEPEYPDHDYYFLTDDMLLLFEYTEAFPYVDEAKLLIRQVYGAWGVEKAYAFFFKMVSEPFLSFEEDQYRCKKGRLADFGFVDYYDSLSILNPFAHQQALDKFIQTKQKLTGPLDPHHRNQMLHSSLIQPYGQGMESVQEELSKLVDVERKSFLQFNFIRLTNATLAFTQALQDGKNAVKQVGQRSKSLILLGFDYTKNMHKTESTEGLFSFFTFEDFYRIGQSLMSFKLGQLKKLLIQVQEESFIGQYWQEFLEDSFQNKLRKNKVTQTIETVQMYQAWEEKIESFAQHLPCIKSFYNTFKKVNTSLNDEFYLNYKIEDIDFETLILNSLALFQLKQKPQEKKLGLTISEFQTFLQSLYADGTFKTQKQLSLFLSKFCEQYGLTEVQGSDDYLYQLLDSHLKGYNATKLKDEDYSFIGGPLILNSLSVSAQ